MAPEGNPLQKPGKGFLCEGFLATPLGRAKQGAKGGLRFRAKVFAAGGLAAHGAKPAKGFLGTGRATS